MTERANHPDFDAAPEERRWTRVLEELGKLLRTEAWGQKGEWAWYVLPRGALVAMRINERTFQKELRIARRLRKGLTDKTAGMWHTEVRTFLEHLGCAEWKCTRDVISGDNAAGLTVEVIYEESAPLGAKAEKCARCGEPAEKGPYKEPLCTSCAIKAGQEEADGNRAARTG